jgi:sulfite exporter TauE/SafE
MLFLTFTAGTITGILAMGIISEQVEKNVRRLK